jgi:hypothetical protein
MCEACANAGIVYVSKTGLYVGLSANADVVIVAAPKANTNAAKAAAVIKLYSIFVYSRDIVQQILRPYSCVFHAIQDQN